MLFSPKATLFAAEREAFVRVLEAALGGIPEIVRVRVGRRLATGRQYEALGPVHEFVAILEFETAEALGRYLDHPAHTALGDAFYQTLDRAVVTDYELVDDVRALKV
ncbi:MAG: Dabb family protein [Vicinamibacterales bacterium]